MIQRLLRSSFFALFFVFAAAGCDDSPPAPDGGSASPRDGGSAPLVDAAETPSEGPFICQDNAYQCPSQATLDACEASIAGTAGCTPLPLEPCTRPSIRSQGTCPSAAQTCAIADGDSEGYCTQYCSSDDACPLPGGGLGTCVTNASGVRFCTR